MKMDDASYEEYPILPLKNSVVFPAVVAPLSAGREKSLAAIEAALSREDKSLVILAQKQAHVEEPALNDLYIVGTKAVIKKVVKGENAVDILAHGEERVQLVGPLATEGYYKGSFERLTTIREEDDELEALMRSAANILARIDSLVVTKNNIGFKELIDQLHDPLHKAYLVASLLAFDVDKSQSLLAAGSVKEVVRLLIKYLNYEVHILELQDKIAKKAAFEMGKESREQFLRQQLRAIQHELGEMDSADAELSILAESLRKANLPDTVKAEVDREFGRLKRLTPNAPDYQLTRTYLELIAELPWRKETAI